MEAIVILAAGQGKRMGSSIPKVLYPIAGQPMISYVIEIARKLNPSQIIVVTSPALKECQEFKGCTVVVQDLPLGTGDALRQALPHINPQISYLTVLCGDTPLLCMEELNLKNSNDLTIVGARLAPSEMCMAYGRIITNQIGSPIKIIETIDATSEQKNINLANTGVMRFSILMLKQLLPRLTNNNKSSEFYLTDLLAMAVEQNYKVELTEKRYEYFQGVNNLVELSKAEEVLQNRWRENLMLSGVRLIMPHTIYLSFDTKIDPNTQVGPFVTFGKNVKVARDVKILSFCHLEETEIKQGVTVGPFARLRNGVVMEEGSAVGNFVEIKGSHLGRGVKAKHLSYLGDATIGDKTNIGAGVITCNYNGFKKFKTKIGKEVMVGVNSTLIAPINICDGAYVAAGSVLSKDVQENSLAISRSTQQEKLEWAKKFRNRQQKT